MQLSRWTDSRRRWVQLVKNVLHQEIGVLRFKFVVCK